MKPAVDRCDDDVAIDCVQSFVIAANRHDPDGYRALLHDDFRLRVDGSLYVDGADAATGLAAADWARSPALAIEVIDLRAADGTVYLRYGLHDRHHYVGYTLFDVDHGRLRGASHFLTQLDRDIAVTPAPVAEPEPQIAPAADVVPAAEPAPGAQVQADRRGRRYTLPLVAIGSWLAQDLLLAAPVVAAVARYGGWRAFGVLAVVYFVASLVLSLATLRVLRRRGEVPPGRLLAWIERSTHNPRTMRMLRAGGVLGFMVSAYLLSAAPTVWALHRMGVRRRLARWAVLASAIWAVGFVGFYAGAATILGL